MYLLFMYKHVCMHYDMLYVTRSRNRRILNENELLSAVRAVVPADRIDFTGMKFRDQVCACVAVICRNDL